MFWLVIFWLVMRWMRGRGRESVLRLVGGCLSGRGLRGWCIGRFSRGLGLGQRCRVGVGGLGRGGCGGGIGRGFLRRGGSLYCTVRVCGAMDGVGEKGDGSRVGVVRREGARMRIGIRATYVVWRGDDFMWVVQ